MSSDLNKNFFTNTYITGDGRQNYLRIDHLEDPLFTSFTFDIDYITSPLFYTRKYSTYGYPNANTVADEIEESLSEMYAEYMSEDNGYDILPVLSAAILDGNKLGFGLQQNVYMDLPLYGATEYIYMVDKRNGSASQNDVRFDSNHNELAGTGGEPNVLNSYKMGDSVKSIVNDSDREWAKHRTEQCVEQLREATDIIKRQDVKDEHSKNLSDMKSTQRTCNNITQTVDGVQGSFTEAQLMEKIKELKALDDAFDQFKRRIVEWANSQLRAYKNEGVNIYNDNSTIQKIFSYDGGLNVSDKEYVKRQSELEKYNPNWVAEAKSYCDNFKTLYNKVVAYTGNNAYSFAKKDANNTNSFLLDGVRQDGRAKIRHSKLISKFRDDLEKFELLKKGSNDLGGRNVYVLQEVGKVDDWVTKVGTHLDGKMGSKITAGIGKDVDGAIQAVMSYECSLEASFDGEKPFTSPLISNNASLLGHYETALVNIRGKLYGLDKDGNVCDISNPSPDSPYGKYLDAKDRCENDDYSQAVKMRSLARSGATEMSNMIGQDNGNRKVDSELYQSALKMDVQPLTVSRNESIVATQTVLDMLGFIIGMKKMTGEYPYIIQGITGLDTAYKNHYGIKDPYLGSGDEKITLTCLESIDLRVSSMFNRYFNAVYDRQYRRERVPVNLRRFNCTVYVHDVRNFVSKIRLNKYGEKKVSYNRLLELTDMYFGAIEFRFYDCEIVAEETGNIFDSLSNEAPSEMRKTNFTFTYGNCVVNFVPPSEVAEHNANN